MNDAAMYMALLVLMGLIFLILSLLSNNLVLGVSSGVISIVTWYAAAGWWLDLQTNIPGIADLFYGIGTVNLIFVAYGTGKTLLNKKEDDGILT